MFSYYQCKTSLGSSEHHNVTQALQAGYFPAQRSGCFHSSAIELKILRLKLSHCVVKYQLLLPEKGLATSFPRIEMVLVTQRKKRSDGHLLGEEQEDERREGMHRGCESESRGGKRRAEEEGEQESKPLVPKQLKQPKKQSKHGSLP